MNLSYGNGQEPLVAVIEKQAEYLVGEPTPSFRDNLHPDLKYVTAFTAGGFTNVFMSHVNLIYIALLSQRIPVIPPFSPVHQGLSTGFFQASEVFNLSLLSQAIRTPVLEWQQIKDLAAPNVDSLGCWSVQETLGGHYHLTPNVEESMHLNFSYTRVPEFTRLTPSPNEYFGNYMALASLSFPQTRSEALAEAAGKPYPDRHYVDPDEQMLCYDLLYYVASAVQYEWEREWSPAWRFVGRHIRWSDHVLDITKGVVGRTFGGSGTGDVPPYISVHVRRTDFKNACPDYVTLAECMPTLAAYARRVKQVQEELQKTRGLTVNNVVVLSDEKDEGWWKEVTDMGWKRIDHAKEGTQEKYGEWYLPVIDVVAQSLAIGFVGTDHSTMSLVSSKRVREWNGGVTRVVRWGIPGADDD
ncbi:hypothetical protein SISSUDRAFT_982518 [Sistotremastrum suecicum HHB10207 ss-3]|nr:hypothetical protein SISSUDRAFT_982518 [Sistotremastrum suecicum HHB10207 ss-3]